MVACVLSSPRAHYGRGMRIAVVRTLPLGGAITGHYSHRRPSASSYSLGRTGISLNCSTVVYLDYPCRQDTHLICICGPVTHVWV